MGYTSIDRRANPRHRRVETDKPRSPRTYPVLVFQQMGLATFGTDELAARSVQVICEKMKLKTTGSDI